MTTANLETRTLDQQISQLEVEIATRQKDIENLRQAFVALESNQLRPADPAADNVFELLKELVGSAPQKLEQQQVYQAKLTAARESLKLAVEASQEKQRQLDALRQERREEQQAEAFEKECGQNQLLGGSAQRMSEKSPKLLSKKVALESAVTGNGRPSYFYSTL